MLSVYTLEAGAIQAGYLIKFIFYLWFSSVSSIRFPFWAFAGKKPHQISMNNNNNISMNGGKNGSDKLVVPLVWLGFGYFKRNTYRFIEMIFLSLVVGGYSI